MAALLCAAVGGILPAHQALAQGTSLVSNTGQTAATQAQSVGHVGGEKWSAAQTFTTGSFAGGYSLSEVRARFEGASDAARVSVYATTDGKPDRRTVLPLLRVGAAVDGGINTFGYAGRQLLDPDTQYSVVFETSAASGAYLVNRTDAAAEDPGRQPGWSLADGHYTRADDAAEWEPSAGSALQVEIRTRRRAPTTADRHVTLGWNRTYTFSAADFAFASGEAGATLAGVRIWTLPARGILKYDGRGSLDSPTVVADMFVPAADLDASRLTYEPPGVHGTSTSFRFRVSDGPLESADATARFDLVRRGNAAPTIASSTPSITVQQYATYVLTAEDFHFADIDSEDELAGVTITSVEARGHLELDGADVTADQRISRVDIDAAKLTFRAADDLPEFDPSDPDFEDVEHDYATFDYRVDDGKAESVGSATMHVDVALQPCDGQLRLRGGGGPGMGSLLFCHNNEYRPVCDDQWDSNAARVACHQLGYRREFAAATIGSYFYNAWDATNDFWLDDVQCRGTENSLLECDHAEPLGDEDCDAHEYAGIKCRLGNAPPTATSTTVTMFQNTTYVFSEEDFRYSDQDGYAFAGVTITSLESAGALTLDGADVVPNQVIAAADIGAGKLTFTPAPGAFGPAYATFRFTVSDGEVDSVSSYAMTVDVRSLAPVLASSTPAAALLSTYDGVSRRGRHAGRAAFTFRTGDYPGGYLLGAVELFLHAYTGVAAYVRSVPFGELTRPDYTPGAVLFALDGPHHIDDSRAQAFRAPAAARLAPSTWYAVEVVGPGGGRPLGLAIEAGHGFEDAVATADGWQMGRTMRAVPGEPGWAGVDWLPQMAIKGGRCPTCAGPPPLSLVVASPTVSNRGRNDPRMLWAAAQRVTAPADAAPVRGVRLDVYDLVDTVTPQDATRAEAIDEDELDQWRYNRARRVNVSLLPERADLSPAGWDEAVRLAPVADAFLPWGTFALPDHVTFPPADGPRGFFVAVRGEELSRLQVQGAARKTGNGWVIDAAMWTATSTGGLGGAAAEFPDLLDWQADGRGQSLSFEVLTGDAPAVQQPPPLPVADDVCDAVWCATLTVASRFEFRNADDTGGYCGPACDVGGTHGALTPHTFHLFGEERTVEHLTYSPTASSGRLTFAFAPGLDADPAPDHLELDVGADISVKLAAATHGALSTRYTWSGIATHWATSSLLSLPVQLRSVGDVATGEREPGPNPAVGDMVAVSIHPVRTHPVVLDRRGVVEFQVVGRAGPEFDPAAVVDDLEVGIVIEEAGGRPFLGESVPRRLTVALPAVSATRTAVTIVRVADASALRTFEVGERVRGGTVTARIEARDDYAVWPNGSAAQAVTVLTLGLDRRYYLARETERDPGVRLVSRYVGGVPAPDDVVEHFLSISTESAGLEPAATSAQDYVALSAMFGPDVAAHRAGAETADYDLTDPAAVEAVTGAVGDGGGRIIPDARAEADEKFGLTVEMSPGIDPGVTPVHPDGRRCRLGTGFGAQDCSVVVTIANALGTHIEEVVIVSAFDAAGPADSNRLREGTHLTVEARFSADVQLTPGPDGPPTVPIVLHATSTSVLMGTRVLATGYQAAPDAIGFTHRLSEDDVAWSAMILDLGTFYDADPVSDGVRFPLSLEEGEDFGLAVALNGSTVVDGGGAEPLLAHLGAGGRLEASLSGDELGPDRRLVSNIRQLRERTPTAIGDHAQRFRIPPDADDPNRVFRVDAIDVYVPACPACEATVPEVAVHADAGGVPGKQLWRAQLSHGQPLHNDDPGNTSPDIALPVAGGQAPFRPSASPTPLLVGRDYHVVVRANASSSQIGKVFPRPLALTLAPGVHDGDSRPGWTLPPGGRSYRAASGAAWEAAGPGALLITLRGVGRDSPNQSATGRPVVVGGAREGIEMAVDTGGIDDPDGLSAPAFTYAWTVGGTPAGSGATFTPDASHVGLPAVVEVTFHDDLGFLERLESAPSPVIVAAHAPNRSASGTPVIVGDPVLGRTLGVDTSGISDADGMRGAEFRYRWFRGDETDPVGSGPEYTPRSLRDRADLVVEVRFRDDAGFAERVFSDAVSVGTWPVGSCTPDSVRLGRRYTMASSTDFDIHEGDVWVCRDSGWRAVCDQGWDLQDAHVACRQLGFPGGATLATASSTYTFLPGAQIRNNNGHLVPLRWQHQGVAPRGHRLLVTTFGDLWLKELECAGTEATLADCPGADWAPQSCPGEGRAGVECAPGNYLGLNVTVSNPNYVDTSGRSPDFAPRFSPGVTEYAVTSYDRFVTIRAETVDPTTRVSINGGPAGTDVAVEVDSHANRTRPVRVRLDVTAADNTPRTYWLFVTREPWTTNTPCGDVGLVVRPTRSATGTKLSIDVSLPDDPACGVRLADALPGRLGLVEWYRSDAAGNLVGEPLGEGDTFYPLPEHVGYYIGATLAFRNRSGHVETYATHESYAYHLGRPAAAMSTLVTNYRSEGDREAFDPRQVAVGLSTGGAEHTDGWWRIDRVAVRAAGALGRTAQLLEADGDGPGRPLASSTPVVTELTNGDEVVFDFATTTITRADARFFVVFRAADDVPQGITVVDSTDVDYAYESDHGWEIDNDTRWRGHGSGMGEWMVERGKVPVVRVEGRSNRAAAGAVYLQYRRGVLATAPMLDLFDPDGLANPKFVYDFYGLVDGVRRHVLTTGTDLVRSDDGDYHRTARFRPSDHRVATSTAQAVLVFTDDLGFPERIESAAFGDRTPPETRATLRFQRGRYSAAEGDTVEVTVLASGGTGRVAFAVEVVPGGGASVDDYLIDGNRVSPGSTFQLSVNLSAPSPAARFTVTAFDDAVDDDGESVSLRLVDGTGVEIGTPAEAVVALVDDDGPPPTLGRVVLQEVFGEARAVTVKWWEMRHATRYEVQWRGPGQGYDAARQRTVAATGLASGVLRIAGLAANTRYTVRVRGTLGGAAGPWSEERSAVTEAAAAAPVLTLHGVRTRVAPNVPARYTVRRSAQRGRGIDTSADLRYVTTGERRVPGEAPWSVGGEGRIPAGAREAEVSYLLEDLGVRYTETVALVAGAGYEVGSPSRLTITVLAAPDQPAAVTDLTASGAYRQIDARWTAVRGADQYVVDWHPAGTASGCGGPQCGSGRYVAGPFTRIRGLDPAREYWVGVRAHRVADDVRGDRAAASATTLAEPQRVQGLALTPRAAGVLAVWEEASDARSYEVQWQGGGQGYAADRTVRVFRERHLVDGLSTGTYTVRVRGGTAHDPGTSSAYDEVHGPWSDEVSAAVTLASLGMAGVTLAGDRLTLGYAEALDAASVPAPRDFVVVAGAGAARAAVDVVAVTVTGRAAVLALARPLRAEEAVAVSYLPAAMHPLRSTAGAPAAPFADLPARHALAPAPGTRAPGDSGALSAALPAGAVAAADLAALVSAAHRARGMPLDRLTAAGHGLDALAALADLGRLRELDLGGNAVADLATLSTLTRLEALDLSGNRIADLWPLSGLDALARLDLSHNRIVDLGALRALTGLEVLLLDGNAVTDLRPLAHLYALRHLSLAGNRVADATLLADLPALVRLDLSGNRLADVAALGDLSVLVWLRLAGNPVADLDPLGRLTHLRWVWLPPNAPPWPHPDRRPHPVWTVDASQAGGAGSSGARDGTSAARGARLE